MAGLSIREAVKHFDVSRPTLSNDLKKGKVSGVKDGQGAWSINHSELVRVYKPRVTAAPAPVDNLDNSSRSNGGDMSTFDSPSAGQVEVLRESLAEAEKRAAESEKRAIENAQRALVAEALAEERKRILDETLKLIPPPAPLTTAPAPTPNPEPEPAPSLTSRRRRWWSWGRD